MRLIDADRLSGEITDLRLQWSKGTQYGSGRVDSYDFVLSIIANTPTVEQKYYERVVANVTFDRDQLNEIVEKAKAEILEDIKKPHGKWIDYSNEGYVECPFCGSATNCEDNKDELHYCWSCGANMRPEEETKDDG